VSKASPPRIFARLGPVRARVEGEALVLTWSIGSLARRPLLGLVLAVVWPAAFYAVAPLLPGAWGVALGFGPTLAVVLWAAPALSWALVRRRAIIRRGAGGFEVPRGMLLDPASTARALPWLAEIRRRAPAPDSADPSPFVVALTAGHRPLVIVLWHPAEDRLAPIFCEAGLTPQESTAFAALCAGFLRAPRLEV